MTFETALSLLKKGKLMFRKGWNGNAMFVALQMPDANSKMQLPYLYISNAQQKLVPWLASQTDLLSDDWHELVR
jgi:hypothetical protein